MTAPPTGIITKTGRNPILFSVKDILRPEAGLIPTPPPPGVNSIHQEHHPTPEAKRKKQSDPEVLIWKEWKDDGQDNCAKEKNSHND